MICSTARACSLDATAISPTNSAAFDTPSTIIFNAWAVSFASLVPPSTSFIEPSIILVVSFAAFADLAAKFLTSSATTAKPFPCWPALAASTAAFNAKILVWKAISSITFIILDILFDESFMPFIALTISCICSLPFSAYI